MSSNGRRCFKSCGWSVFLEFDNTHTSPYYSLTSADGADPFFARECLLRLIYVRALTDGLSAGGQRYSISSSTRKIKDKSDNSYHALRTREFDQLLQQLSDYIFSNAEQWKAQAEVRAEKYKQLEQEQQQRREAEEELRRQREQKAQRKQAEVRARKVALLLVKRATETPQPESGQVQGASTSFMPSFA